MKDCNDFPEGDMPGVEADVETPEPKMKWLPGGFCPDQGRTLFRFFRFPRYLYSLCIFFLGAKSIFLQLLFQSDRIPMLSE